MVDSHAIGACGFGRAGSNPASPTRALSTELDSTATPSVTGMGHGVY